jgi:hypothetical protein
MAKGGTPAPQTQTTTYQLSPEQRELMNLAMPGVREFAASTPQRYQGSTITPFNAQQVAGQDMVLNAAGGQGTLAQSGADASNFWLSGAGRDPSTNPGLKGAIDAATRPIMTDLMERALPGIRSTTLGTGLNAFGGSRRGLAEGRAVGDAATAIGDTGAKIVNAAYDTNVNAELKALGLLPQTQQTLLTPGLTTSGVGDTRQAMDQRLLDEQVSNFNWDQMAPFLQSKEIMSLLQGLPGGSTTSTSSGPTQPSGFTRALGGAAQGASLGSMIMPGIGTAAGGLLGGLFSFL